MQTEKRIYFFDTTLRDGEQTPGAAMSKEDKVAIALQLEKLGVDIIEAGFPASNPADFEAVKAVAKAVEKAQVAGLARASADDINACWNAIKFARNPRIHTFIATSDLHITEKLNSTREKVLQAIADSVSLAKSLTENVEFSAEDGSRSDPEFLCQAFACALDSGATTLNLPDTVGYAEPEEFGDLVHYVLTNTPGIENAILSVHCHNDLGLATANTLTALRAGARQAEVTINGIGERAGNTAIEEVVMAIHTRHSVFPFSHGINTELIYPTSQMVSEITGIPIQPNKAIVGANAFAHESGIHQAGVLKNPMTYEIMRPEIIGLTSNKIILGKLSGTKAMLDALKNVGYSLNKEDVGKLFESFKALAAKKKNVTVDDLVALHREDLQKRHGRYELTYINVTTGNTVTPVASVKIKIDGQEFFDSAVGNGPVNAAINALFKISGTKARMGKFRLGAIGEGEDAQGEAIVPLQENGWSVTGRGVDPDIIVATAKAFVNGLNRLQYMQENPSVQATDPTSVSMKSKISA